jgi:carboxyl-terminal processing protease
MKYPRLGAVLSVAALLSACGGGGGGSAPPNTGPIGSTPAPTPSPSAGCTLRARQDWAAAQLREWYLFPETLPGSFDPSPFSSVEGYIDSLTAAARSQRRDRFFT